MAAPVERARPFPQPGRLVVGVLLDVACKASALLALVAVVLFGRELVQKGELSVDDPLWGLVFLGAVVLYGVLAVVRYQQGRRTLCSLCRGPVFHEQRSSKSRNATKLPGLSHRTSIVLSLLFTGRYHCMYCGTPFRLKK